MLKRASIPPIGAQVERLPFLNMLVRSSLNPRWVSPWAFGPLQPNLLSNMLLIYAKSEQDDLSREQLQVLRKIVEAEYR